VDNNTEVEYVNGEKKELSISNLTKHESIQAGEEEVGLISNCCDVRRTIHRTAHASH